MAYRKLTGKILHNTGFSAVLLAVMMFLSQFGLIYLGGSFAMPRRYQNALERLSAPGDYFYFDLGTFTRMEEGFLPGEELRRKMEQAAVTETVYYVNRLAEARVTPETELWAMSPIGLEEFCVPETAPGGYAASGIAPEGEDVLEMIAVGDAFPGKKPGECFTVPVWAQGRGEMVSLPVRLAGRLSGEPLLPFLRQTSSRESAYNIFSEGGNYGLFLQTPQTEAVFASYLNLAGMNQKGILFFREDAGEAEKQALIKEMKDEGALVQTAEEIRQNTQNATKDMLEDQIGLPLFCLWISFVATIVMLLLVTDSQLYDLSVYFLLGLSKRQGYWLLPAAFSALNLMAMIPNLLIVAFVKTGDEGLFQNVRFSGNSLWLLLAHFLFFAAVVFLEGFLILRKKSFLEIKNREWK